MNVPEAKASSPIFEPTSYAYRRLLAALSLLEALKSRVDPSKPDSVFAKAFEVVKKEAEAAAQAFADLYK